MPARSELNFDLLNHNGIYLNRPAATLPATATVTQFNVTGMCLLLGWILEVSTAIQAQANAIKGRHTPTGGSVGDVSGTIDVNGYVVGDYVVFQGPTAAGALSQVPLRAGLTTGAVGWTMANGGIFLRAGALGLNTAATNTGATIGHLWYKPLLAGSKITVA